MKKILILQGHPDANNQHFCDAISNSYSMAAIAAKHEVKKITITELDFNILLSYKEYNRPVMSKDIISAQQDILWAEHVVIIYPLWLGDMPALLKGFFEQALRPGFAIQESDAGFFFEKNLVGRSARIFVTMGMPSLIYRWFYRAHTLKSLQRNILNFCGFKPVRYCVLGGVYKGNGKKLKCYLSKVSKYGANGE